MKSLLILAVFISALSCNSSTPKDILPQKKMQDVLWDMMQADEMAEYYSTTDSSFKMVAKHVDYYQKIFEIHKINKESFTASLKYYKDHPARLKPIFDSLQRFAQRLQNTDTLNKKPANPLSIDSSKRKLHVRIHPK
jgi:hypothetical protein